LLTILCPVRAEHMVPQNRMAESEMPEKLIEGEETAAESENIAGKRLKSRSKRGDPAWKPYTLMLKSGTHKEAAIILRRMDSGKDMSDLAQELFEQWVSEHLVD